MIGKIRGPQDEKRKQFRIDALPIGDRLLTLREAAEVLRDQSASKDGDCAIQSRADPQRIGRLRCYSVGGGSPVGPSGRRQSLERFPTKTLLQSVPSTVSSTLACGAARRNIRLIQSDGSQSVRSSWQSCRTDKRSERRTAQQGRQVILPVRRPV